MFGNKDKSSAAAEVDVNKLVAENDAGGRNPGPAVSKLILDVCLAWSLFQLWIASPLPFTLGIGVFNDTQSRAIHLAFAVFLAYLAYPAWSRSPRDRVPALDWVFALVGAACASYLFVFYRELATRPGQPIMQDLVVGVVGMVLLLEATRRALGLPMVIVAIVFLIYTFGGPYMPDMIARKGASLSRVMSHHWLTTEGVFGVALGVSSGFIFLFVLFGSLLDKAGAGNHFIQSAFALLGHMRGGHHRRHGLADRHRPGHDRGRRTAVGRQPDADAGAGRRGQPDPGHGPADDGQLHRRLDPDGAGGGRVGRTERPDRAADRGPPVRLLLRADGRRHAAGRPGLVRGRRDCAHRPDQDGGSRPSTACAPPSCRSCSSSTPSC